MSSRRFKKTKEDFFCENCNQNVIGNGYTNHCPRCLWSKHVDIFPGDRAAECCGLMEPFNAEKKRGEWSVIQKCQKCGKMHKNKISKDDNFQKLTELVKDKNLE